VTDYLTNAATLGMAEGVGMTGMNGTGGFGGSDESPRVSYTLRVNGLERPVNEAWIGESLLYVLRERLGLAGAKGGCDQGECGACSVQVDGQLTAACLVPAALAADSEIRTVEGLTGDGTPSDVQRALAESGAVQCGYCVPGLAMAVHDLLERNHQPTDLQAREALCGNLCRCTGYSGALAAVQAVSRSRAEEAAAVETSAGAAAPAAGDETGEGSFDHDHDYGVTERQETVPPGAEPPAAAEPPVYVDLPAQQTAEPDPLYGPGPVDGVASAPQVPQVPQYAGYPSESEHQPQTGEYHTGQFPLPDFPVQDYATGQFPVQDHGVQEHGTGQFPVQDYATGQFPLPGYATDQFAVPDFANGEYPGGEYPQSVGGYPAAGDYPPVGDYPQDPSGYQDPNGYVPAPAEAEPGVYVLPHQQQHTHAPAPEAGA
jgi:aerobic-type carbon monoxide dehydrogenase small subunit (CoxS/CutS family)